MDLHKITLNTHERFERYTLSFKPEYIESLSSKETDLLECFFLRPFSNPYILPLTIPQAEECLTQLKRLITCNDDTAKQDYGYDLKVKFLLGEFLIFINNLYRKYHNISSDTITSSYSLIYSVINISIHTWVTSFPWNFCLLPFILINFICAISLRMWQVPLQTSISSAAASWRQRSFYHKIFP